MMKHFGTAFVLFLMVAFVFSSVALSQQTAQIIVKGVSDKYKAGNAGEPTYGLKTVPVGNRVVVTPRAWSGLYTKYNDTLLTVTSAAWSITGPATSTVTIQDTAAGLSGKVAYFVPDLEGQYTVTLAATTVKGVSAPVNMTFYAAKFVGSGLSLNPTTVPSGCGCHLANSAVFTDWQKTKHATALTHRFDGLTDAGTPEPTGGHFANYCMPCHAAGYYKSKVTATNGGYGEAATTAGFNVVSPQHVGVYDSLVTAAGSNANLSKALGLMGIQCESCHGPAGEHVKGYNAKPNTKMDVTWSSDVCAPCHFSSDRHPKGYSWEGSRHSVAMYRVSSTSTETSPNRGTPQSFNRWVCNRCHTGNGYVNQIVNGLPEPIAYNTTSLKAWANPSSVSCQTCHDPHSDKNPMQLRSATIGDACVGCHSSRVSTSVHESQQGPMLVGADAPPMTYELLRTGSSTNYLLGMYAGFEFAGYTYENSSHSAMQDRCVDCHMAKTPTYDPTFVVADTLLNKVGGHTFGVAYAVNPTTTLLNYVGCEECHGKTTIEFVDLTKAKVTAMLAQLKTAMPKRDSAGTTQINMSDTVRYQAWANAPAAAKVRITPVEKGAAYNYNFVINELSLGVHNFKYTEGLLKSSIEQMQLGSAAGSIYSIKDVPGDQGRKIQIIWNKFPAESYGVNPVTSYGLWRRDPNLKLAKLNRFSNYTDMITSLLPGQSALMGSDVWTYVASVPKSLSTETLYSYVAATLFDSTKVAGMKWSAYYVAGYTGDNMTVYASPVDSGYSVDNISPVTPMFIPFSNVSGGVQVAWQSPVDPDVDYYNLYRGTTTGFNPAGVTPTKVKDTKFVDANVTNGNTYFYRLEAIDASGNKSPMSSEAAHTASGVTAEGTIPTEFALSQNFPNPFNPSTTIKFGIPQNENVRVTVFTLSGVEVKTLVNGQLGAGSYSITWDGTNAIGEHVASGMYLYRISAGTFNSVKKMVMLK